MEASDTTPHDETQQGQGPQVPTLDHMPQSPEEVQALSQAFADYRKEVAALRNELAASRGRPPVTVAQVETEEDRQRERLAAIGEASHYCPGCGRLSKYPRECTGPVGGAPHAPIEMVATEELNGDPADHTAAPATEAGYV